MGKKKEHYLYLIKLSLDDNKGPRNERERAKYDRNLSHAVLNLTRRNVKSKYATTEGIPKEWC